MQILTWARQWGICLLHYLDDWMVILVSALCLLDHHRQVLLQLYTDLGIVIGWEKLEHKPKTRIQYLMILVDTMQERVYAPDFLIIRLRGVVTCFRLLPARLWQQLLGHMGSQEHHVQIGKLTICPRH